MDAIVAEPGGGELEFTEVAAKYLGGHGHDIVDHVHDDGGGGEDDEELGLDP